MHYSKTHPFLARIIERERLDKPGSTKPVFHLTLDISGSNIEYTPGDSIGVLPTHNDKRVSHLITLLELPASKPIHLERKGIHTTLAEALKHYISLDKLLKKTIEALACISTDEEQRQELMDLSQYSIPARDSRFVSLETILTAFKIDKGRIEILLNALPPLLPRFYSIANSKSVSPGKLDLLIAPVIYETAEGHSRGVASDFLCESASLYDTPIPIFPLPNPHFSLPIDHMVPLIMIGPGTGVAPFRAFLQERTKISEAGHHFLFFGDRHRNYNFTYQDYMMELEQKGLMKLFTAFSRDQKEKKYVHHLMHEEAPMLFEQIHTHNAHIYICGDAKSMAKDVKKTLMRIFEQEGDMTQALAKTYLKELIKSSRLLLDVY